MTGIKIECTQYVWNNKKTRIPYSKKVWWGRLGESTLFEHLAKERFAN